MTVEERAWEFSKGAFEPFDLSDARVREYAAIIAELLHGAVDEERERIAGRLEHAADLWISEEPKAARRLMNLATQIREAR